MQTMIALLKREWQEHVFGFGWGPVTILGVLILISCLGLLIGTYGTATVSYSSETRIGDQQSSEQVEITDSMSSLSAFIGYDRWSDEQLRAHMASFRLGLAKPFQYIYVLIAIFILLGSLHEDRRDRSVLFWKSMPVTDTETVLSKLVAVAWVAPAAFIAAIVAAQLFLMVVISGLIWAQDLGSVGRLWWNSGVLVGTVELVVGYLIQGLWALPLYAWLLAVSAAAPRVPFVWAVVVPFVPMAVEKVAYGTEVIYSFVRGHAGLAAMPAPPHVTETGAMTGGVGVAEQLGLLATAQMWLGLGIAALLLWAAIWFRTRNNDL